MFPNFSELSKTGDRLTAQFEEMLTLLRTIADNTTVIRHMLEEKDHG